MNNNPLSILLIFIIPVCILNSCVKKEKVPPDLPSVESLLLDLSFFEQSNEQSVYFDYAAEKVLFWQILINDSLSFQRNLLETAVKNDLEYQSEQTWLIRNTLNFNDKFYDLILFCIDEIDSINYKLYFSSEIDTFSNLLSLDGTGFFENTQGYWTINKPDTSNTYLKFLTVKWETDKDFNREVKFTNFLLSGEENGNSILYKDSFDNIYDSYIDLFEKGNENHTYIQWDTNTNQGRIKDNEKYGNDDWHCWDENLSDTECN